VICSHGRVPRPPLSRLVALLWVAVIGLLPATLGATAEAASTASAASTARAGQGQCTHQTVADSSKAAMAVFTGTVTAVTPLSKPDGQRGAIYNHMVTVTRVYQGKISQQTVQVQSDRTPHECSLGALTVGSTYMFFVTGNGAPWLAEGESGTALADPQLLAQVVRLLGEGKPAVQEPPEQADFTALHPPAPQTLSRVAAPGLALVLVGLLGLVVVRGLARRAR
jgi:hypothetical protein